MHLFVLLFQIDGELLKDKGYDFSFSVVLVSISFLNIIGAQWIFGKWVNKVLFCIAQCLIEAILFSYA